MGFMVRLREILYCLCSVEAVRQMSRTGNITDWRYSGFLADNLTLLATNCSGVVNSSSTSSCFPSPSNEETLSFPPYIRITATTVCSVILTLGTAGNILVAVVVCRTKELRNSTNLFLINLSLADLMVLLVCVPPVLVELHSMPEVWLLGEGMCKAVPYVELTATHGSILTILAISFERYYAICEPLKAGYTCTQMRAVAIITVIWVVALVVTSPVLLMTDYQMAEAYDHSLVPVCLTLVEKTWQKLYYLGIACVLFLIPFLVLLVVYGYIARHLILGRRVLTSTTEEYQMRARRQVVCMLIAVVVCFFFCLLPFRVLTLWIIVTPAEGVRSLGMETYYNLLYFCRLLLYMNSALNPILYNVISSKFRNSLLKLLKCTTPSRMRRSRAKGTTSSSTATTSGSIKTAIQQCNAAVLKASVATSITVHHTSKTPEPHLV